MPVRDTHRDRHTDSQTNSADNNDPSGLQWGQYQEEKKKCAFKYSAVITFLCDVIADVVDVNVKTRPLASDDRALLVRCELKKDGERTPNSPHLGLNPMNYSI